MRQKCCIMGIAVLALLCVMCGRDRAAGMEQRIGRILNFVVRRLDDHIPAYTDAASAGARVYTDASAGVQAYTDAASAGARVYTDASAGVQADGGSSAMAADSAGADAMGMAAVVSMDTADVQADADTASGRASDGCALDVPEIFQLPELPTGCEATALAMALGYDGIELDKTEIADHFLVYNREDDNMARGYVGDPFSEEGAGCFAPAIRETAEKIFAEKQLDANARDISGTELRDLLVYLDAGRPVIVWTTMYMAQPEFTEVSARYQGRTYRWYRQEHCVVLSGYDPEARTVQVNDPLEGVVQRDMDAFRDIYDQTGQNAVVLYIKS